VGPREAAQNLRVSQPAAALPAPARPPRTWKKRLLVAACSLLATLVLFELVARVGAWLYYGRNPYYLFYGFVSWTAAPGDGHSEKLDGYFKFPPNQVIRHGLPEPGRINNHGFRGADFEAEKPAGTFRIVCLGGSSTFGYTDSDDGTYPYHLQRLFEQRQAGRRVEVINGGIPHFNTNHLVAMLEQEALGWAPDALTLYCAYNDAIYPLAENVWQEVTRKIDEYSAGFAVLRKLLNATLGNVVFHQWSEYLPQMDAPALARQIELHREMTRTNLEQIARLAATRATPLVVVRQPMTLWAWRRERGLVAGPRPALTYEGEVAEVRARLEQSGAIQGWEAVLLVHRAVLEEVDAFAARHGFALIDNVALLDAHPDGYSSYVHLNSAANARLAEALHAALAPLVPGG
jgi:lysophospholipase L1-like esterase